MDRTMAGGSTNMIVFPPLLRLLLDAYGWRGAMLVTSAICANLCVVGSLYRPLRYTPRRKTIVTKSTDNIGISPNSNKCSSENPPDSHVQYGPTTSEGKCVTSTAFLRRVFSALRLGLLLKSYRFSLLCLTSIQLQMTYSCASVFLVPRAKFSGTDDMKASFLLSIFGFGSLISRVASGFFVTRKTPVEALYTFSFVLCCVGLLSSQAETYASFAASACILGMGTGANKVWSNILIRKLLGLPRVASGQAIHLLLCGVGDLIGPIVAGLAVKMKGSVVIALLLCLGCVLVNCQYDDDFKRELAHSSPHESLRELIAEMLGKLKARRLEERQGPPGRHNCWNSCKARQVCLVDGVCWDI